MNKILSTLLIVVSMGCSTKDQYDVSTYYNPVEQDKLLTSILVYIFDAPPMTLMKDRFKPEHRNYYSSLTPRFSINRYFVDDDGTHYFYLVRPAPSAQERRGVGGHFKMKEDFQLAEFREVFVTPILPEADVKGRSSFLFDEMVKGNIDKYLGMPSYVQWPNPSSYYDTLIFQWKLKPGTEINN